MADQPEESSKWSKVKVNEEYYVLKESISDTSSSSGNDSDSNSDDDSDSDSDNSDDGDGMQVGKVQISSNTKPGNRVSEISCETPQAQVAKKSVSPEYVPLRNKESSGSMIGTGRNRSDSVSKETPERWRLRLWPSKAITAFCRIITRCKPPASTPGIRIGASAHSNHRDERHMPQQTRSS